MTRVYVSIGTNIDREHNVRAAVDALRRHYGALRISPVYETAAVGFEGHDFYNLVVGFDTDEQPETLRDGFQAIESEQGRRRGGERFASRTLDIDLLTWGDCVMESAGLTLPRGEILKHAFVLRPLADIAPETTHPVAGLTYSELWTRFEGNGEDMREVELGFRSDRSD
jgi:2-amino-4-hydroxy-6-hydroxymethyldihydropteridine diphosphokinase